MILIVTLSKSDTDSPQVAGYLPKEIKSKTTLSGKPKKDVHALHATYSPHNGLILPNMFGAQIKRLLQIN